MKITWKQGLCYGGLFLGGVLLVILVQAVAPPQGLRDFGRGLVAALQPVIIGVALTYLFYPPVNAFERQLVARKLGQKTARAIASITAGLVLLAALVLLCSYLLPLLLTNLTNMVNDLPGRLSAFSLSVADFLRRHIEYSDLLPKAWLEVTTRLQTWLQQDWMPLLESLASGLFQILKVFLNVCIGIMVMVYLLLSRDQFIGQCKKTLYALCGNRKVCAAILRHLRHINKIFSGFITGKLIDSLVIGLLCWVGLRLLGIPYAILISVVIGFTNIIPIFGPFIGAIPCAFLLLLEAPSSCLIFVIFIILLQQLDGNLIGPMILGDSVGLPAFWVLFSLLLFQYLMGFWGMIVGVPLFAAIYYLLGQLVKYLLHRRRLPTKTRDYVGVDAIDQDGRLFYLHQDPGGPLAGPGTVEPAPEPLLPKSEKKEDPPAP